MLAMASFINIFLFLSALLSLIFSIVVAQNTITLTDFTKLNFPSNAASSGSLAFDMLGGGPFAGNIDGRIIVYSWLTNSFRDYGYTSPIRREFCDGTTNFEKIETCGYTTGLSFKPPLTQNLYANDGYFGLTILGIFGGAATTVVPRTQGAPPYKFPIGVDAANDGMVYFVDASGVYGPRESNISRQTKDSTGRLVRYNPRTRQVTTLLSQLARPVGVATTADASIAFISEQNQNRIQRFFLQGEKADTSEIILAFQGDPNKIKRNQEGNFWAGVNTVTNGAVTPQAVKFSPSGEILATIDLSQEYKQRITTVLQQENEIFVVGLNYTYIGKYRIKYTNA